MVSERTSLLPGNSGGGSRGQQQQKPPHPDICIRTTVTPWSFIPQIALVYIRFALAAFFTAVLAVDIVQEAKYGRFHKELKIKAFFFYLSNISWFNQTLYYWFTSYWTVLEEKEVDSLYRSERHRNHRRPVWKIALYWCDHVPQGQHHRYSRFIFSFFYTLNVTVPFFVTLGYWVFLFHPHDFTANRTKTFCLTSIHGVNSLVAILEVLLLNSQEAQEPLWAHALMIVPSGFAYYGWLWVERAVTGVWMYKFVDPHWRGKKEVAWAVLAAFAVAYACFFFQYFLHVLKKYFMDRWGR